MATQQNTNILKVANPPIESGVRTYLTADTLTGATTLSTVDNSAFTLSGTTDYYVLIGEYGSQKSEIVLVDANGAGTNNTGFTVSACKFSHQASDPVTYIKYNKINVYGATITGGSKTLLTATGLEIDPSEQYTTYDYDGTTYSYFYIAYYNSTLDQISGYSDEIVATSFTRKSIKRIIEAGLRKAMTSLDNTQNSRLNWDVAVEIVQDGIDEILAVKRTWPFLRAIKNDTTTTADINYIEKPDDLTILEFLIVNNRQLSIMPRLEYNQYVHGGMVATTGEPEYFLEKNNKYYLYPTPNSAFSVIYEYYKTPATITSDLSSEIDMAFVPVLIHYCAAHFAWIRGNDKRGDKMYKLFETLLEDQRVEYSGFEQTGQAESIDRTSIYNTDTETLGILY